MTINSVKHKMLELAKKIANKVYEDKIIFDLDGAEVVISSNEQFNNAVNFILGEHPEFNSGEFRRMIKEIQVRNKSNEVKK